MKIIKIEPTPSPNTLKVVLDYTRDDNKSRTYKEIAVTNPAFINDLLRIQGITSIFHVMDFISVDKAARVSWEQLLPEIKNIFDEEVDTELEVEMDTGEQHVELLMFKDIPYQIKVTSASGEKRKQLDVRFIDAMMNAQKDEDNVVFLRKWISFGVRYGEVDDIIRTVQEEVDALYPDSKLDQLVQIGLAAEYHPAEKKLQRFTKEDYAAEDDWRERYRMLDHFPDPDIDDLEIFKEVMKDERPQLRRLGIVFLGMIGSKKVLPLLHEAMSDSNLTIRRTAGDTLSDLGFKESLPVMHEALDDKHRIVRWRAAMFIFDEGDASSLPYLSRHVDDEAFEVRLQCRMAEERIINGEAAVGSVWKQIANRERK